MGIYDRDYMSDEVSRSGHRTWTVVAWLLIVNTAAFIMEKAGAPLAKWGLLDAPHLMGGVIWRLLTLQFCHEQAVHFLLNMLALFVVGRMAQVVFSEKQVLLIYLWGGVAGGLFHIIGGLVSGSSPLLGASASIMAIFCALAARIPEERVYFLLLPFQARLKQLGWLALGLNVAGLVISQWTEGSRVSYASHLGGMAMGWFFVVCLLPFAARRALRTKNREKAREIPPSQTAPRSSRPAPLPSRVAEPGVHLDQQVDAILEKISAQGIKSLTVEERRILEKGSEKLARKLNGTDRN